MQFPILFQMKLYPETWLQLYRIMYLGSYLFLTFCQIFPVKGLTFLEEIVQNLNKKSSCWTIFKKFDLSYPSLTNKL